jgi:hypothetical protein
VEIARTMITPVERCRRARRRGGSVGWRAG